ncbi:RAMP superfamily CRISPR-associated protein [Vibrio sp. DNB22_12_1]
MSRYEMTLDIKRDWHIGSGEEGGAYADALILRDAKQLPYVPGKSIKGLYREAFNQAQENGWFEQKLTPMLINYLFGQSGQGFDTQGILHFANAVLPVSEQAYFIQHTEQTRYLTRVLAFTAIDSQTGVAKNASLRQIEVAIPMVLYGQISVINLDDSYVQANELEAWLKACANLILSLGAKRHRGLGEVLVTVNEMPSGGN